MKKEFKSLSEKRKELLKYFKEQFGEKSIIPQDILRVVEEQDKEAVELLKEELMCIGLRENKRDGEARLKFINKIDKIFGKELK